LRRRRAPLGCVLRAVTDPAACRAPHSAHCAPGPGARMRIGMPPVRAYRRDHQPRVVALGGGHGLAATLGALRHVTTEVTAVVTVADDGGSSGRLRQELGVLPPGDLRMALSALCDTSDQKSTRLHS